MATARTTAIRRGVPGASLAPSREKLGRPGTANLTAAQQAAAQKVADAARGRNRLLGPPTQVKQQLSVAQQKAARAAQSQKRGAPATAVSRQSQADKDKIAASVAKKQQIEAASAKGGSTTASGSQAPPRRAGSAAAALTTPQRGAPTVTFNNGVGNAASQAAFANAAARSQAARGSLTRQGTPGASQRGRGSAAQGRSGGAPSQGNQKPRRIRNGEEDLRELVQPGFDDALEGDPNLLPDVNFNDPQIGAILGGEVDPAQKVLLDIEAFVETIKKNKAEAAQQNAAAPNKLAQSPAGGFNPGYNFTAKKHGRNPTARALENA